MNRQVQLRATIVVIAISALALTVNAGPMSTAFTYQGQIRQAGMPLTGTADFEISLWDEEGSGAPPVGGNQVSATVNLFDVEVTDGLFSVQIDFGTEAFAGHEGRWMEIAVRSPHDSTDTEPYITLSPRQPLTPAPYAVQTRGLYTDDAGNVGVAKTNPNARVDVDWSSGVGVFAGDLDPFGTAMFQTNLSSPATTHAWFAEGGERVFSVTAGGDATAGNVTAESVTTTGSVDVKNSSGNAVVTIKESSEGGGLVRTKGANGELNVIISAIADYPNNGGVWVYDAYGEMQALMTSYPDWAGELYTAGPNSGINFVASATIDYPDNGAISIHDSVGNAQAGMYVDALGSGIVWGDWKWFRAPNPNDPSTEIWYGCLEGPEQAAYVRGTGQLVNGEGIIMLPDHFKAVARGDGMTVQVSPLSAESKGLAVVQKSMDGVVIRELNGGHGSYDFDYMVTSPRKGSERFAVVRPVGEGIPAKRSHAQLAGPENKTR